MARWYVRFLVVLCLVSLVLSVTIINVTSVIASSSICIQPNPSPVLQSTPLTPTATSRSVVFNEVLPFPRTGWNCNFKDTPTARENAWIELYNLQDRPLDLYQGIVCIDTGPDTKRFRLSVGSIIPAHGFFTLFPYTFPLYSGGDNATTATFSTLRLFVGYDVLVDQVTLPKLPPDVSYARAPDGTGQWRPALTPTMNASNIITASSTPSLAPSPKKHTDKPKATVKHGHEHTRGTSENGSASHADAPATEGQQAPKDAGEQTSWHNLQFPPVTAPLTTVSTIIKDTDPAPPQTTTVENIPQKVLFSLLGVAGTLALWWGWRRFFKKT